MATPPNSTDFNRGVQLFNRAHFFDAHEVLEDVWRSVPRDQPSQVNLRRHLQGMVQLAVAFHHESTGNHVGARSVLARAIQNLNGAYSSFPDLDLDRLRADLVPWQEHLDNCEGLPGERSVLHHVLHHNVPRRAELPKIKIVLRR